MKNEQTSENIVVYERANRHGKSPCGMRFASLILMMIFITMSKLILHVSFRLKNTVGDTLVLVWLIIYLTKQVFIYIVFFLL